MSPDAVLFYWTGEGCDPGVWVLRSCGGDTWASVKPRSNGSGYRVHWFGLGRGRDYHWIHEPGHKDGLLYAMRRAEVKAELDGNVDLPDLGIDWSAVHVIEHSIGHWTGPTKVHPAPFRNHFATGCNTTNYPICMNLVAAGLMEGHGYDDGRMCYFLVTDAGFRVLRLPVPAP